MSANSTENQKPLVSIIIPFYNREDFLSEAIESVLEQTVKDWELILVDDGSTDKSVQIAERFIEKYPLRIHIFSNQQNKGASVSRNLGISRASGKYLTFLDSDDIYFPDTLERELKAFSENPDADVVCGTLEVWYSWSAEAEKRDKDFKVDLVLETDRLYLPPDLLVHNLNAGGRKPGINSVIVKRDLAAKLKLFEDDFESVGEDQVFWAKVCLSGKVYVLDDVLAKYRQHPASTCAVETAGGSDIPWMKYLDWLENYLRKENIENGEIWKALRGFQRTLYLETKLRKLKQLYRRFLPLHSRYKIRDKLTKLKQILARATHRHK